MAVSSSYVTDNYVIDNANTTRSVDHSPQVVRKDTTSTTTHKSKRNRTSEYSGQPKHNMAFYSTPETCRKETPSKECDGQTKNTPKTHRKDTGPPRRSRNSECGSQSDNLHRKLARSRMMDTLDVPSSNENLTNLNFDETDNMGDQNNLNNSKVNTNQSENADYVIRPSDERRRGLASPSFRANWQIMSASFNSERYYSS